VTASSAATASTVVAAGTGNLSWRGRLCLFMTAFLLGGVLDGMRCLTG
jgi:hypothetical protein